jgi:hypothetical protein
LDTLGEPKEGAMKERLSWDEAYCHERQALLQTTVLVLSLVRLGGGRTIIACIWPSSPSMSLTLQTLQCPLL